MKKILALMTALFIAGMSFAQTSADPTAQGTDSYADTKTRIIKVEDKYADQHVKAKTVDLQMEYTPLTGDVIFYYVCMQSSYDQGEAMNTAMAVFEDFALENKYKHYVYTNKDKSHPYKDERGIKMMRYTSRVRFTR